MGQNLDARITRTDKMIKDAFLDLVDTIGFEKITVMNLTKKAMISRTTFYLHYMDKYDLLEQIENEILDGVKNIALDIPFDEIVTEGLSSKKPFSLLLKIYKYIEENQKIFKLLMCNNIDSSFYFKFHEAIRVVYNQNIDTNMTKIPENYALALIIGVHTSIINEWIKTGMKETPEEIVLMIVHLMHDAPKNLYK